MSSIISMVSSLVSAAVSWLSTFAQLIVGYTPATESTEASWSPNILTLFVCLSLVGLGIGLLRRLKNI